MKSGGSYAIPIPHIMQPCRTYDWLTDKAESGQGFSSRSHFAYVKPATASQNTTREDPSANRIPLSHL
ncbi:hypothetical protein GCM10027194_08130 [Thalassiella azotivora]